jgi:hypothetical protein
MLRRLRGGLTYANVTATLALFIALGGSSYAALKIDGQDVRNGSLTQRDLKRNTLTGRTIRELRLDTVRQARLAARLEGPVGRDKTADQLTLRCPTDTRPFMAGCLELTPRAAVPYGTAAVRCEVAGRRLPTHQELSNAIGDFGIELAPGGELTANVYPGANANTLNVLAVTSLSGYEIGPDTAAFPRAFRCVAALGN